VFNDCSKDSVAIIKKNLNTLKIAVNGEEAKVMQADYLACLQQVRGAFDIIFLDPPYRFDYGEKALKKIAERGLLSEKGIAVYERDIPFDGEIFGLEKYDERKYGKAYLTFFKRGEL
jgi:16S rRNA G966 N2-methylase RsmD